MKLRKYRGQSNDFRKSCKNLFLLVGVKKGERSENENPYT